MCSLCVVVQTVDMIFKNMPARLKCHFDGQVKIQISSPLTFKTVSQNGYACTEKPDAMTKRCEKNSIRSVMHYILLYSS